MQPDCVIARSAENLCDHVMGANVSTSPPPPRGEGFSSLTICGDGFRRISKQQNPNLYYGAKVFVVLHVE